MCCVIGGEVLMCYVLALLMTHVEGGPLLSCNTQIRCTLLLW